jgi:hypothetical protein
MMDISAIASMATSLATAKDSDALNIAMLKKALDTQATTAAGLIEALPKLPSNPNIGRTINTTA